MSDFEMENIISLLGMYRDEWKHRDKFFWSVFWKFTYLSLIIGFFPDLLDRFQIKNTLIANIPNWIFSIAGIAFSVFGLFMAINEMQRIQKLDEIHYRLIDMLPSKYRIERISPNESTDKHKTERKLAVFRVRTNYLLCGVYFIIMVLLIVTIIMKSFFR